MSARLSPHREEDAEESSAEFLTAEALWPDVQDFLLCAGPAPGSKSAWSGISRDPTVFLLGGHLADGKPNLNVFVASASQGATTFHFEPFAKLPPDAGVPSSTAYLPQYQDVKTQLGPRAGVLPC